MAENQEKKSKDKKPVLPIPDDTIKSFILKSSTKKDNK